MKKFNALKILDNDKFVKIISLIGGILIWIIVVTTVSPNTVKVVENVPITVVTEGTTAQAYGLSVIDGGNQTVDIKVEGKRYKIGSLDTTDFVATATSTSVVKSGEFDVDVVVKKRDEKDPDYSISSISESRIKVLFDHVEEKTLTLEAVADKIKVEEGFIKETPYVTPAEIKITGPKSELDKIARCAVVTNSDKKVSETLIVPGELVFYDAENNQLKPKHISYPNHNLEITIPIYLHKVVPLKVDFLNVPTGFDVSNISYSLSSSEIEIAGPKSIMDNIKDITIGQIDFRKIDIGTEIEFDVTLLAGIVNVNNVSKVKVDFNTDDYKSKYVTITNVLTKNEPANYTIKLLSNTINNVKIVGRAGDIKSLSSGDVVAVVDLADVDLTSGSARVAVKIHISGEKIAWPVGEYMVVIKATKK